MALALTVGGLLRCRAETLGLSLELLGGGAGLERVIVSPHIQKTGLALAGFAEYLQPGRVLVFGESEIQYLDRQDTAQRTDALVAAYSHDFPCVVITGGGDTPAELVTVSERHAVPVLRTSLVTPTAIAKLTVCSPCAR